MRLKGSRWLRETKEGRHLFRIGKHKGEPVQLVDHSYLNWILNTVGPEGEDREIMMSVLNGTYKRGKAKKRAKKKEPASDKKIKELERMNKHLEARIRKLEEKVEGILELFTDPNDDEFLDQPTLEGVEEDEKITSALEHYKSSSLLITTRKVPYMEEQDDDMGREAGMEYHDQPLNDDIPF